MFAVQFVRSVILPRVEEQYRVIRQCRTAIRLQLDFAKENHKDHLSMRLIADFIGSIHRSAATISADMANALLICSHDPVIEMVIKQSDLSAHQPEHCTQPQWSCVVASTRMQLKIGELPINDLLIVQFHARSIAQACIEMLEDDNYPIQEHTKIIGIEARELRYHLRCAQELFLAMDCDLPVH